MARQIVKTTTEYNETIQGVDFTLTVSEIEGVITSVNALGYIPTPEPSIDRIHEHLHIIRNGETTNSTKTKMVSSVLFLAVLDVVNEFFDVEVAE